MKSLNWQTQETKQTKEVAPKNYTSFLPMLRSSEVIKKFCQTMMTNMTTRALRRIAYEYTDCPENLKVVREIVSYYKLKFVEFLVDINGLEGIGFDCLR